MSSLQALNGFKLEVDLIQKILKDYLHLTAIGKTIMLCWIPSHVNIPWNEKADCAAKSALSHPITNTRFPAYDLAPYVSKFCLKEWQDIWDACQGNKLYAIYRNIGGYQYIPVMSGCCTNQQTSYWSYSTYTLLSILLSGMINQNVLLVSPSSLLSTFSLNVLILLLSVPCILVLLQWKMYLKKSMHKAQMHKEIQFYHEL